MGFVYLFSTISLTVYGQLIVKWRVGKAGALPTDIVPKIRFLTALILDPWILSALLLAVLAAFSWMAAMTKFELSYAYPFISLSFVMVTILSAVIFREPITLAKVMGLALVVTGIIISSRG
jgi:multidrug transporter EmrE-like cation transporter